MIIINNYIEIINSVPYLLQYIVPGCWCLLIIYFFNGIKINNKNFVVIGCIISYILLSLVDFLCLLFKVPIPDLPLLKSAFSILIGTLLAVGISIFFNSSVMKHVTIKLFHKTVNKTIWRDIFDLENGSNLKVYIKDKNYYVIGHLKNFDEDSPESWLALSGFAKFDKYSNKNFRDEPSYLGDNNIAIAIRLSDVEHIEIF